MAYGTGFPWVTLEVHVCCLPWCSSCPLSLPTSLLFLFLLFLSSPLCQCWQPCPRHTVVLVNNAQPRLCHGAERLLSMPRVWHAFQSHLILLSLTWCSTRSLWFSICLSGYMTPESKSFQKKLVGSDQPCPPTKTTFSPPVSLTIHRLPHPPHSLLSVCISLWHILCGSPLHCHWRATVSPDFFRRSPLNLIPPLTDHPDVVGTRLYPRCHSSDAGLY